MLFIFLLCIAPSLQTNPEAMANVPLDLRSARVRETKRIAFARKQAPSLADFPAEWLPPQQQQQQ